MNNIENRLILRRLKIDYPDKEDYPLYLGEEIGNHIPIFFAIEANKNILPDTINWLTKGFVKASIFDEDIVYKNNGVEKFIYFSYDTYSYYDFEFFVRSTKEQEFKVSTKNLKPLKKINFK